MRGQHLFARGAVAFALALSGIAHATPGIGEPPPDLLGKTAKGDEIRISDHRGKVMIVSFWASWCGYCRKQFPVLDYLQKKVGPDRMRVVVVNYKEDPKAYRSAMRQARDATVTWTHDRNGELSDAFGVNSVPHTFVIDKAGNLAHVRRGYSEESLPKFFAAVNELLADSAPETDAVTSAGDGAE